MAAKLFVSALLVATSSSSADCASDWYERAAHGPAFRNVRHFGAVGDGVHDDTAAIQAALDFDQPNTGDDSGMAPAPAIAYLPAGTYLVSDTITLWLGSNLVGNALCPPTLLLAPFAPGFGGSLESGTLKPVIATSQGYNISLARRAWWVQEANLGGHGNNNFFVHVRCLRLVVGAGNPGAVGVLWIVAQQTSIRNVSVDLSRSGAIGFDQLGADYNVSWTPGPSFGGGGSWEDLSVEAGAIAFRLAASQYSLRNLASTGASQACLVATSMGWALTVVALRCDAAPVAVEYHTSPGSIQLLDSTLGPGLGPVAIVTDGLSSMYLQNVHVQGNGTAFVVDGMLPVPIGGLVLAWGGGTAFYSGMNTTPSFFAPLPLPSAADSAAQGVPLKCAGGRLCGGSFEDPTTGLAFALARPSFNDLAPFVSVYTYGAKGDGLADDTAAIRAAFASGLPVFLPAGIYKVSDTIQMPCNATLVGEALSMIALARAAPGFLGPYPSLKAVLATSSSPFCFARVADIALGSLGTGNDGALLLDHRASALSAFWDFTMKIYYKVGLKARIGPALPDHESDSGGGTMSNVWFWAADHNTTDDVEMSDGSPDCTEHCSVGLLLGVEITTSGPLLLIGANFEHASESEFNLTGASNVVATVLQTEGEAASMLLDGTSVVTIFATLFGSGTGHGRNNTLTATRGAGKCVKAATNGHASPNLDLSYRILGAMQKNQPLLMVDDDYTVVGDKSEWREAAFFKGCSADSSTESFPAAGLFPQMESIARAFFASELRQWKTNDLKNTACRDVAAAAFGILAIDDAQPANVTDAAGMLTSVFEQQFPSGQWPWIFYAPVALDNNSVQFTALPILRSVIHFGDRLDPALLAKWLPQLELAAQASFTEGDGPGTEAQPYYTNIATMRLVNLFLFAQVTRNATVRAWADKVLAQWTNAVDSAGIHEFASPTYTAVAVGNLVQGAASIADAAVAATLRRYVRFLLAHSAATLWAPARELGGAHSRDYDFCFGAAGMDWVYALSGLAAAAGYDGDDFVNGDDGITMSELYIAFLRGELAQAPAAALALAPAPTGSEWRVQRASWSPVPGQVTSLNGTDAYFFASAVASLGTSSMFYGPQDKLVVAQLGLRAGGTAPPLSSRLAQITVVQDCFDSPYGFVRSADGSGHEKPSHLKMTVAAAQDLGLALVLNDLSMAIESTSRGVFSSLAANVLFPAGNSVDAVYVNGQRVANTSHLAPDLPLVLGDTVAVRSGGGIVAFRVPFVDGLNAYEPTQLIKFDGESGTDAARLATYLYVGPNTTFPASPPPSRSIFVLAVGAAASDDEARAFSAAFAALVLTNSAANPANWHVTLAPAPPMMQSGAALPPGFSSTLSAAVWVPDYKRILRRDVNGSAMPMPLPGALEVQFSNGSSLVLRTTDFSDE